MTSPGFLVAGHAAQDVQPSGEWRLGGAVSYAATLAHHLGLRTAVLTSASPDVDFERLLPGIDCRVVPSSASTRFHNRYELGRRRQTVTSRAASITAADLPQDWRGAPIVLLGPLVGEVGPDVAEAFDGDRTLMGIGAQGWLREVGPDGEVRRVPPERWDAEPLLQHARALFLSDEDVRPDAAEAAIRRWLEFVGIVAFTHGDRGADVYRSRSSPFVLSLSKGEREGETEVRHVGAFPARVADLTGAGDVFAAGFLISLKETGDVWQAARFASCAASFVVEGQGLLGVPTRDQIEARLREHPEIVAGPTPSPSDG